MSTCQSYIKSWQPLGSRACRPCPPRHWRFRKMECMCNRAARAKDTWQHLLMASYAGGNACTQDQLMCLHGRSGRAEQYMHCSSSGEPPCSTPAQWLSRSLLHWHALGGPAGFAGQYPELKQLQATDPSGQSDGQLSALHPSQQQSFPDQRCSSHERPPHGPVCSACLTALTG